MSELHSEGMTFDQAKAALTDSGAADAAADAAVSPALGAEAAPVEQAPEPTPGADADLGGTTDEFTSPDGDPDSFMGEDFNPDLLPEELQPGFKQLQGNYTRKTQELAEQRKALEALGDPEELAVATEFYRSLQDPEYLKNFYAELGNVVEELGLSPQDAAALEQAALAPEAPVAPELSPELAKLVESDPELTPLAQQLNAMQTELAGFRSEQAAERQALAEERQLMAQAAEIDRMVQVVREEHPNYGDDDWKAIYDRAVAFDGDVLQAAELFEADRSRIIADWTASKQTPHAVTPTSGGAVVTDDEPAELHTLDDAQRAAEAYMQENDIAEFSG